MITPTAATPARAPHLPVLPFRGQTARVCSAVPVILITVLLLLPDAALSQPVLNFKRVTVNWPTMELYFTVGCDGSPAWDMRKEHLRIHENGVEIPEFTLWCPDPAIRCAASVALVADASASMKGGGIEGVRAGLTAFAQMMDGVVDEAALITAGNPPVIRREMTVDKPALRTAIDSLRASGGSAIWDGAMMGLEHLINTGENQCRALILCADGMDNLSATTLGELITRANRNRIRIFTLGYGNVINATELELLAQLTGGRHYQSPNAGQLAMIYEEITASVFYPIWECIITYDRDCADGTNRTVDLQLRDYCDGEDAKSKTYIAPLDSTTYSLQRLRIETVTSVPREEVTVPLLLDVIPGDATLRPFDITIASGTPARPLIEVSVPAGSPLDSVALRIDRSADSVRIRLDEDVPIAVPGTLLELRFHTQGILDSSWFPLGARVQDVHVPCAGTVVSSGGYRIVPRLLPRLTPEGELWVCPGGTVELTANEGFVSYRWSTGDTTRSILADADAAYFVDVVDGAGDTLRSAATVVRFHPRRRVWLEPQGALTACRESNVDFRVAGDTAGARIFWKWESAPRSLYPSKVPDKIWARVVDEFGCVFATDTIWTNAYDPPVTLNVAGDVVYVCPGDSVALRVMEDYPFYFWDAGYLKGDSVRGIFARADGGWHGDGRYSYYVRDSSGCRGSWHSVTVKEYPRRTIAIDRGQRIVLCPDAEARVSGTGDFAAWRWSTGDTTRTIPVRGTTVAGTDTLWVEGIAAEGCVTRSAPLVVETVTRPAPRITPGTLTALCPEDRVRLDAGEGYESYRWSTGDTTRFIEVDTEGGYVVAVTAHGGCVGISDTLLLRREDVAFVPVTYAGSPMLCPGGTLLLEAPEGYANYRWNTGARTRTLAVHAAGAYAVSVLSPGGCEGVSELVHVGMRTQQRPRITRDGLTLSTGLFFVSHQWLRDGQPISGAAGPIYEVTDIGRYAVQVVDSCGAVLLSDEINITTLGIASRPELFRLDVYPDPSDGRIHLDVRGASGPVQAELHDLLGRRITRYEWRAEGVLRAVMDFHGAPPGIYILRLAHSGGQITRRLTKTK
ncbi:MAG: VWA domain-containing protein [Bacteroidota bacterium]|jgi:hypothetical protein|nr:VWA domain-containing protein [Bacteroidota bacterium]